MLNTVEDKPVIKNSADPSQIKKGRKSQKLREQQEKLDLEWLMSNAAGRRVMWRLLGKTGMFKSVWEQSAKIHFNAGKQDYGLWLWSAIEEANPDCVLLMMKENRKEIEDV